MVLSEDEGDAGSLPFSRSVCCTFLTELSSVGNSSEGLSMGDVLIVDICTL